MPGVGWNYNWGERMKENTLVDALLTKASIPSPKKKVILESGVVGDPDILHVQGTRSPNLHLWITKVFGDVLDTGECNKIRDVLQDPYWNIKDQGGGKKRKKSKRKYSKRKKSKKRKHSKRKKLSKRRRR